MITKDPAAVQLANRIRNTSYTFFLAYQRCWTPPIPGQPNQPILAGPMIVNLAFAVETGIKALLTLHSAQPKKRMHELHLLYAELPADVQQRVRPVMFPGDEFSRRLEAATLTFVEWRYWYEPPKDGRQLLGDGTFLAELARALLTELDTVLTPEGQLRQP